MELRCCKCRGKRRVDVAGDDDKRWSLIEQNSLDADERLRSLLAMRPGSDTKKDVRRRKVELVDEYRRHLGVVVLARVDEQQPKIGLQLGKHTIDGRCLHEIWSSADDEADWTRRHPDWTQSRVSRCRPAASCPWRNTRARRCRRFRAVPH